MNLTEAHRWLNQQQQRMQERIQRWSAQNSGSVNLDGLRAMAEILKADFKPLGFAFSEHHLPPYSVVDSSGHCCDFESGPLLAWRYQPTAPQQILLMIHYDTVYAPGDQPSVCTVQHDMTSSRSYLVGPGTADAKGGIAVMLTALECLAQFNLAPDIGLLVLLNPDEEIGSAASWPVVSQLAVGCQCGLLFEPAMPDGALVAGRKGTGNFTLVMHGRAAHSGRNPEDGRNAIVRLSRLILELDALNHALPGLTINVANVQGGGPLNRVPDLAIARVNVRVLDLAAMEYFQTRFRELIVAYHHTDYRLEVHGGLGSPPKSAVEPRGQQLRDEIQLAAEACGRPIVWRESGGASDGNKLESIGIPNVDSLGPTGFDLHSPTERCDLNSLVPAAQTVVEFIHQRQLRTR